MTKHELTTVEYFDLLIDIASHISDEGAGQLMVDLKKSYPEAYKSLSQEFNVKPTRQIPALMREPYGVYK
jgi:hypothetical protein